MCGCAAHPTHHKHTNNKSAAEILHVPLSTALSRGNMIQHDATQETSQPPPVGRTNPGILRLLPETLPFYPYRITDDGRARRPHRHNRRNRRRERRHHLDVVDYADDDRIIVDDDGSSSGGYISNSPLIPNGSGRASLVGQKSSLTLFFLVDATNRQSLNAIPAVSHWFHRALMPRGEDEDGNRVICMTNQPSPDEVHRARDDDDDDGPTILAEIDGASARNDLRIPCPMLVNSGFYYLPFRHPKRSSLIHLLGATRVPSIVVVSNVDGRIVTRHGWEAVSRELQCLDDWIVRDSVEGKKCDDGEGDEYRLSRRRFESDVVRDWRNGNSGLPLYWHLLSWIL